MMTHVFDITANHFPKQFFLIMKSIFPLNSKQKSIYCPFIVHLFQLRFEKKKKDMQNEIYFLPPLK